MYPPMELDGGTNYYLKPMNCPMHILIYRARGRSYRELPLRMFEFGTVYRYEKSGVIHGLTRVRGMTQDDAHIFTTIDDMRDELRKLLTFVLDLLRDFGLDDFYLELSTKNPDKYVGDDEVWETATATLAEVAAESGLELVPDPGGAAFYGPKISVQARDAIGRTWQMSTIQVDFNLPERFELEYQGAGRRAAPAGDDPSRVVRVDRALLRGAHRALRRRFPAMAGAGTSGRHPDHRHARAVPATVAVGDALRAVGVRFEVDDSDDRMQKKIRNAQKQKVPFMLIAGDDDVAAGAVSFRYRDGTQKNGVAIAEAVAEIRDAIERRVQV